GAPRLEAFVGGLLKRPLLVVFVALVGAGLGVMGLVSLGTELLPPSDPRQFSVRLVGPPGQRVESTTRTVVAMEELLREAAGDDLIAIQSEIGRLPEDDRLIREEQTEENTARILVRLRAGGASGGDVVARAAPAVTQLGNIEVNWEVGVSALARSLGTSGPPVAVEISGQSLPDLRDTAESLRSNLAAAPALWNVRSSFEGGPPELRVELDRTLADGLGVDLDLVSIALEASLDGRSVTVVSTGDEERDVVLRMPSVRRDDLLQVPLTTSSGARLVVGDVARLRPESGAREIFRRDQRRVAQVTARIVDSADYPQAIQAAQEAIDAANVAPGLSVRLVGEEEERTRTFDELKLAGILALLLVFMVLAGTFESLIHPLTVAISIPLSLIGVALVLVPMGRPLGVMEVLGLIVLAGVAVNDAILLVDSARRLMLDGMECTAALARAAAIRLRPILMTTFTTVLAMSPLAWGGGEGAQLRQPLALTIIGGIILSTVCSLTVIPCVYLLLERLRPKRARS
ncbi:MAG: efflux RND transporter permease subunit, partial [Acidobacteriota bacterium]|nr:efflux RND transporter permease subunit [Acidobacteriota bacterium]